MRAINAVRELNEEREDPITVIAIYTEQERHALFVRQADEGHCLGPATGENGSAYLDYELLERALTETEADAAWVGWGFVAEHPEFAELCERLGIVFVGPSPDVMRALGDKIEAKKLAEEAGVPVAPWSGDAVESAEDAARHAERLGFPLMIKAAAGGGGRGMRRVESADEVAKAFERAQAEAEQSFGDPRVLMEVLVGAARHVEVQLLADGEGAVWALGVRDCSYQRRHQKVVEESASPALDREQERELAEAAVRLARNAGYRGAGTAEFLYEPESRKFSFMEVNARLQVEHPVTEVVTGADLVRLQLHIAEGGRLEGDPPPPRGHAIEVRLNAEDPGRGFAPAPGRVTLLRLPTGPGVRVDTGVAEGDVVPPEFDSMIAKIIAHGENREQAIARLRRAVADTMVALDEGTTNQGFLLELLGRPELRSGEVDTGWLDRLQARGEVEPMRHADAALIQAAIALCDDATASDRGRFYALARRGRPHAEGAVGHQIDLVHRGTSYRLNVGQTGPGHYRVQVDEATIEAEVEKVSPHERRLRFAGRSHRTMTALQDTDLLVEVDGVPHRVSRDEGGLVRSHAPGVVVAVPVSEGDEVHAGDVVAVTESMKMELSLTAPVDGRVREVLVSANAHVTAGKPLLSIEPLEDAAEAEGDRVTFADSPSAADPLQRLQWAVLGYDVADVGRIAEEVVAAPLEQAREQRLLETYADVRALNRPQTGDEQLAGSPQEHLHAFLRSLDPAAEGLPERFVTYLERAVAHYGIEGLERTAALEEAGYRLFLSQQRSAPVRAAVQAVLDRRLEEGGGDEALRGVLDRLETTLRRREPALAELAREVRWRTFDEPLVEQARAATIKVMEGHLAALAEDPGREDRGERIAALVNCPQPLAGLITNVPGTAGPLVEAMTRRYYRIRALERVEQQLVDGVPFVVADYEHAGVRHHVAATLGDPDDLPGALRALATHAGTLPDGEPLLADLYAREGVPEELGKLVAELPSGVERVAFVRGRSPVDVLTFQRDGDGALTERSDVRGLHPMMAERMELWRLENFELERLAAAPDVYLFNAVARENERDERLVALAEVRDLTPVRDDDGRITALPELERMIRQAFEAMRSAQQQRPARQRLLWNRLVLYTWPAIEIGATDAGAVIARFARETAGLGLEMVLIRGRVGGEDRAVRIFNPAGRGVTVELDEPPTNPLQPLDDGAQRIVSARRRGTLHPAEIVKAVNGEFVEHDLDEDGELVPVDRPPATNDASVVVGLVRNRTERYPEGMLRVALLGDPTRSLGSLAEPECRRIIAALDLAEQLDVPVEWFAVSSGAKIAMDSGTENMDWVAAALRRIVRLHAGRRRDQRDRDRHQRRRPAVLQRRGDDADAHARHPRDDARQRDGADRQAGARLLGRRLGGGQLRHRRLRPRDGPQRPGAVLGARHPARLRPAAALLRAHLRGAGRALPAPRRDHRPVRPRHLGRAARGARLGPGDRRRDLQRGDQPGPQEAVRHPLGDARGDRPRRRAARALGRHARGRDRRRLGRAPRRPPGGAAGDRVAAAVALRRGPGRRSRAVDLRHAVPRLLEEDRPRDQRGVRAPAAGRARQPRRLRRLAGVDAPAAARVRRRDRPRDRQLRRPDRLLRDLALPRRRVRRLLAAAQRRAGDDRARGCARVGDRRRAGRRGRVRARRRRAHPQGSADRRAGRADRRRRRRRAPASAGRARGALDRGALGEARRAGRRVRLDPQRRSAPSRSARSTGWSPSRRCGAT